MGRCGMIVLVAVVEAYAALVFQQSTHNQASPSQAQIRRLSALNWSGAKIDVSLARLGVMPRVLVWFSAWSTNAVHCAHCAPTPLLLLATRFSADPDSGSDADTDTILGL